MRTASPAVCAVIGALAAATVGCASTAPLLRPSATDPGTVATAAAASAPSTEMPAPGSEGQPTGETWSRSRTATSGAVLLENTSSELAAAMARQAAEQTAESEVRLAQAFMRHGVLDKASEHFAEASRRDPREGSAWDGLARIWRDSGFPELALGDAYRAVYASPDSPGMRNTLGTILLALGRRVDARAQFARATTLDPTAAYAWNNLCYAWLTEGNFVSAISDCGRALAVDPGFAPAARNLALARAMGARGTGDDLAESGKGSDHERR